VIENAVFAFKQPPTLVRHIAVTCVVVALTVLASLLTDCVGIVLELNVRTSVNPLLGTLKPHSNGPLYSSLVIGTLAVDGGVLHLVERGGAWAGCGPVQSNFISFDVALLLPLHS